MATVDAYTPLDMLNGFDFSILLTGVVLNNGQNPNRFDLYHSDSNTVETITGYGFTYDYTYGVPNGGGTVSGYELWDPISGGTMVSLSGLNSPLSTIIDAAFTSSKVDDQAIVSAGLSGDDLILASVYNDVLDGFNGNDSVYGFGGNDTLYGEAGNDYLNGGVGADAMFGGFGDDVYEIDHAADRVYEAVGQGSDIVVTSIDFALASGQEVEGLAAGPKNSSVNLQGNQFSQAIAGNNAGNILSGLGGDDVINGFGGNDKLFGSTGNDTLWGGGGKDVFVFNTAINSAANVDVINDFNFVQDTIWLDNAVMHGLGAHVGTLASVTFWKSANGLAHDANDRIIYETDTGWLNYDNNGSAKGGSVHIARLDPNLGLSHADFFVV